MILEKVLGEDVVVQMCECVERRERVLDKML